MRVRKYKIGLSILVVLILEMVTIVPALADGPQMDLRMNTQDGQNTNLTDMTLVSQAISSTGLYFIPPPRRVISTTTIISDNPDPSKAGQTIDVWFTLLTRTTPPIRPSPIFFHTVTVSAGGNSCRGMVTTSDGRGHCRLTLPQAGRYVITARCESQCMWIIPPGGDFPSYYCYFVGSSDTESHTVVP